MGDVYITCPIYIGARVELEQVRLDDAEELFRCYADEKTLRLCNTDDREGEEERVTTREEMENRIRFWQEAYKRREFIRFTVRYKKTGRPVGTVEMYHRRAEDAYNDWGFLKIDLASGCESQEMIGDVLRLADTHFYQDFDVDHILTKAPAEAGERRRALESAGFRPLKEKFLTFDDYFYRD